MTTQLLAFNRDTIRVRATAIALLAGAIAVFSPLRLDAQRAELEKFIRHRVLANGLEVIVAENHGVPLATVEFNVRNGSFTQRPGTEGLAHMYEHMFFKANDSLPAPDAFIQKCKSSFSVDALLGRPAIGRNA